MIEAFYRIAQVFSMCNREKVDLGDAFTLTGANERVKMHFALRVRSSMVEQWPFKPLVESSSLSALTDPHIWGFIILMSHIWGFASKKRRF